MKKIAGYLSALAIFLPLSAHAADCEHLDARLNVLATADQGVREEWNVMMKNGQASAEEKDALQKRWRAIDEDNLQQFKAIIAACGWPTEKKASHTAWLLAQHADSDLAFQHKAKDLLEAAVKNGSAAAGDLAYLADRIATAEGRPQEYGTQFMQTDRCHLVSQPVDDIERVKGRRLAVGLQSLDAYLAEGRKLFIPADCPPGDSQGAAGSEK